MKHQIIHKVLPQGIELPASKSISNRLLVLNGLLGNELTLYNLSEADDTVIMKKVLDSRFHCTIMDVKNAGTCYRFLTAYNALKADEVILKGSEEMNKRPIKILVEALQSLGAEINYLGNPGYPPLRIVGNKLKGGKISLLGSVSSQYLTALCLIGPFMENGLELHIEGELKSASYLEMTIALMQELGFSVVHEKNVVTISPFTALKRTSYEVEADWSSASYWYSYLSFCEVGEELFLPGLKEKSIQGDAIIASLFEQFDVQTIFEERGVRLKKIKEGSINQFEFNFSSIPDMVQTFVVACIGNRVKGVFKGISHLKYKETNRIEALQKEVEKLGARINLIDEDSFELVLKDSLPQTLDLKTYQDHRMAMAFAPLVKKGITITIENPEVVVKSYPGFWKYFG